MLHNKILIIFYFQNDFPLPLPLIPPTISKSDLDSNIPSFLSHMNTSNDQSRPLSSPSESLVSNGSVSNNVTMEDAKATSSFESVLAAATGNLLASAPVRRYKQYSDESLQKVN